MAEPIAIAALMKKRAEIDGELRQVELRAAQLRADRKVIDATIGMFDPTKVPHRIRPRVRRPKPVIFKHGECSRAVIGVDIREPHQHATLLHSVRNAVLRHSGKKVERSEWNGTAFWKIMN
jgi:hypothetical protein